MDGAELFTIALAQSTMVVKQVLPEHFANSTPDTEWSVRELVGHMLYELSWVPDILAGKTMAEVGDTYDGDLIGDDDYDLSDRWQAAADKADLAIANLDPEETAHLSYGDVPVNSYLEQAAADQLVHAWDVGKAIGVTVHFDAALSQIIYDNTLPHRDELEKSGLFAPAIEVADSADIQTRLLAIFGRDANWQRS